MILLEFKLIWLLNSWVSSMHFGFRVEIFGFRVNLFGFRDQIFDFGVGERLSARDDGLHQQLAPPRPA